MFYFKFTKRSLYSFRNSQLRRHDFAMSYPRSALIGINSVQVFSLPRFTTIIKKLEGKIESLKHIHHIWHGQIESDL